jgi:uncharacterized protein (TIGR01777 family)
MPTFRKGFRAVADSAFQRYVLAMSKRVVIYGVSGFVGKGLASMLASEGWEVIGVSRKGTGAGAGIAKWTTPAETDLSDCEAVVNLSGEPIDQRWTAANKRAFHSSRIGVTDDIVKKISALNPEHRPKVLVNASAVGYYGGRGDEVLDETASRGDGYLADLCAEWENAALPAEALGVRVVRLRIGVVLGRGGKAFEKLLTVFKAGIGGRLGNGKQWTPWIHVDDLRRAIVFSLNHPELHGAVNGTAPNPETNGELTCKFAKAVGRPAFFPVPGWVLKLALGGFGGALLQGQRAVPKQLLQAGFEFRFAKLEDALRDLVTNG